MESSNRREASENYLRGSSDHSGGRHPAHFLDSALDAKAGRVPGMTYSGNRSSRVPAFLLGRVWAYLC